MKKLIISLTVLFVAIGAMADVDIAIGSKPFNMSITPDVAIYGQSVLIKGMTLSLWGENEQDSLALGIVNGSSGFSSGVDWAFALNYADNFTGVKWAVVNHNTGNTVGWDAGFLNYSSGAMKGVYTGIVNYVGRLKGVQFGLFNYVETGDSGVQIGLINIIDNNDEWFSDMPNQLAPWTLFVNWRF